jgi:hypothetical protein
MSWLRGAMFLSFLTAALSAALFYRAEIGIRQHVEVRRSVDKRIVELESTIALLTAERAALTRPERLDELAARHLDLRPLEPRQIGSVAELPWREAATGVAAPAVPMAPLQSGNGAKSAGAKPASPLVQPIQSRDCGTEGEAGLAPTLSAPCPTAPAAAEKAPPQDIGDLLAADGGPP